MIETYTDEGNLTSKVGTTGVSECNFENVRIEYGDAYNDCLSCQCVL